MAYTGTVVGVRGSVVDLEFTDRLPGIDEAVHVEGPDGRLVIEVQQHLSRTRVRGIAMASTAGLSRGAPAEATGRSITVPVGKAVMGRMINVLGEPIDDGPPIGEDGQSPTRSIHAQGPSVAQARARTTEAAASTVTGPQKNRIAWSIRTRGKRRC
ncbi:MAG: hypothetical protein R6X33_10445 [Candidatus Brocadiia bacterium]